MNRRYEVITICMLVATVLLTYAVWFWSPGSPGSALWAQNLTRHSESVGSAFAKPLPPQEDVAHCYDVTLDEPWRGRDQVRLCDMPDGARCVFTGYAVSCYWPK